MRKIAIRIDDVAEDMDWEKFRRFEKILEENKLAPLIGVIPQNKDASIARGTPAEDFGGWLKKKQAAGWCIAMHGYEHLYKTKAKGIFPLNPFSEFSGISYKEQCRKISDGKKRMALYGIDTAIFMAPGHSFDENTIRALKKNGFQYVTDGFGNGPFVRDEMTYLPIALQKSKEFEKKSGITTFVVHTATMRDEDFAAYEKMLSEKRKFFVDYRELLETPPKVQTKGQRIKEYALAWMKGFLCRLRG